MYNCNTNYQVILNSAKKDDLLCIAIYYIKVQRKVPQSANYFSNECLFEMVDYTFDSVNH